MGKKKEKKELEPQYYISATNMSVYNYKVYYMNKTEKILYFLLAFAIGAVVAYLFYGGIGKNELGNPTMITYVLNILIPTLVGTVAGIKFIPIREKQIIKKKKSELNVQFRDMLDGLNTALGAGKNVPEAFTTVYGDLSIQYEEGTFILNELEVILSGLNNNIDIEGMLEDLGQRSGIVDIVSFASVFRISYRKGGSIKDIIRNTYNILSEKMEIQDEIETTISSGKMNQNIMVVMPVALIGVIKMMSPDFADRFVTPTGIISTTIALGMFVFSYWLGKELMDIKV